MQVETEYARAHFRKVANIQLQICYQYRSSRQFYEISRKVILQRNYSQQDYVINGQKKILS